MSAEPLLGCSSHACDISTPPPGAMGTNGHCNCDERKLRRALRQTKKRLALTNAVVEAARPLRSIRGPMPLTPQTRELFGNLWAALDALDGERSEW